MKQLILLAVFGLMTFLPVQTISAGEKDDAHIAYIFKNQSQTADRRRPVRRFIING